MKKKTCAEALGEWKAWRRRRASPNTLRTQEAALGQMFTRLKASAWPVTKLEFDHIDGFVNAPNDSTGRSNREVRLSSARSFFKFIVAKGYYEEGDPSQLVSVILRELSHDQLERTPRVPFTPEEFALVMAHTTGQWRWWTALGYWAGLRLSDCACLEWASVLPDEIVVWTRKAGTRIALPLDDPLFGAGALRFTFFEIMEEHPETRQYIFPAERLVALDPARRSKHSVYFGRILDDLEIKAKSFHCLRHSFATRLAAAGKTIEQVGRAMGHGANSAAVTNGYVHL